MYSAFLSGIYVFVIIVWFTCLQYIFVFCICLFLVSDVLVLYKFVSLVGIL